MSLDNQDSLVFNINSNKSKEKKNNGILLSTDTVTFI